MHPFCDWLTIEQVHPGKKLPVIRDGVIVRINEHGERVRERGLRSELQGSYDTRVWVGCDGAKVTIEGNVGRFGRPDNVFGYCVEQCIELASDIVQALGLPRFERYTLPFSMLGNARDVDEMYSNPEIKRVDLTCNYLISADQKKRFLQTLSGWRFYRQQHDTQSYTHGVTFNEGSERWYAKFYDKTYESGIKPDETGLGFYGRFEVSLKYKWLKEHGLNYLHQWQGTETMSNVVDITAFAKFEQQLHRCQLADTESVDSFVEAVPSRLRAYVRNFLDGHDMKQALPGSTYFRVRKRLLEFGIDISTPMSVDRMPVPMTVVKIVSAEAPAEFHRARPLLRSVPTIKRAA